MATKGLATTFTDDEVRLAIQVFAQGQRGVAVGTGLLRQRAWASLRRKFAGLQAKVDAPDRTAAALRVAQQLQAEGLTLRAIGWVLTQRGFEPKGAGKWHPQTVARLLVPDAPQEETHG